MDFESDEVSDPVRIALIPSSQIAQHGIRDLLEVMPRYAGTHSADHGLLDREHALVHPALVVRKARPGRDRTLDVGRIVVHPRARIEMHEHALADPGVPLAGHLFLGGGLPLELLVEVAREGDTRVESEFGPTQPEDVVDRLHHLARGELRPSHFHPLHQPGTGDFDRGEEVLHREVVGHHAHRVEQITRVADVELRGGGA